MSTELPEPLAAYFEASNAHNTDTLLENFTTDAIVQDEGHEYFGLEEIGEWNRKAVQEYHTTIETKGYIQTGNEIAVKAVVSGTFDGSPIELNFQFTVRGDKISALQIQG